MALTLRRNKGFALTFDEMDDNFLHLSGFAGLTIANTAPLEPVNGQMWLDTGITQRTFAWYEEEDAWVDVSPSNKTTVSTTQPEVRLIGDGWFDTSPGASGSLLIWNGNAWVEVIGAGGGGTTTVIGDGSGGAPTLRTEDSNSITGTGTLMSYTFTPTATQEVLVILKGAVLHDSSSDNSSATFRIEKDGAPLQTVVSSKQDGNSPGVLPISYTYAMDLVQGTPITLRIQVTQSSGGGGGNNSLTEGMFAIFDGGGSAAGAINVDANETTDFVTLANAATEWRDIASVTLNTNNERLVLNAAGEFSFGNAGEGQSYAGTWRFLVGDTVVNGGVFQGIDGSTMSFSDLKLSAAGQGSTPIKLQAALTGSGNNTVRAKARFVVTKLEN